MDIAKTNSLTEQQETELIEGMFGAAGLEDKNVLTYEDFKLMMREYKGDFIAIGLDCKGAKQNFLDTSTNIARWEHLNLPNLLNLLKSRLPKSHRFISDDISV